MRKQLEDYEKELADRDGRLHELEKQLRGFLDKNYELRDAVQEIRQLKEQMKLKDRQMEDLAQYASKNELLAHEVTDENDELRTELGKPLRKPMSADELKSARLLRTEANQAVIQVLQKEVRRRHFSETEGNVLLSLVDRTSRRRTSEIETELSSTGSTSWCESSGKWLTWRQCLDG